MSDKRSDLLQVAESLLEWIDALPKDLEITKAMPGVDRDWVERVIAKSKSK